MDESFFFFSGSENLSVSKNCEPGEKSAKDENDESCNTKCDDNDAEKTIANLEKDPSSFMANNKDSSTLDHSKSSSFIPEPPSSPSLISLSDEEDELTPSLGLENHDLVIVVYTFLPILSGILWGMAI